MSDNEQFKDGPLVRGYAYTVKTTGARFIKLFIRFIKCPQCEHKFELETSIFTKRDDDKGKGKHTHVGIYNEVKEMQPNNQANYQAPANQPPLEVKGAVPKPEFTEDDIPF